MVDEPQAPLHDLELGGLVAADPGEPLPEGGGVGHPVPVPELLGVAVPAVGHRGPPQEGQGDL